MNKEIGVGIIGAGMRGALVLGERLVDLCPEVDLRLTAICEKNPLRAKEAKEKLSQLYQVQQYEAQIDLHPEYESLIQNPRVHVILITTPTHAHLEPARLALQSGKKVYLDKPIAVSLADSQSILNAENEFQNPLIMGFTRRYENTWQKCFELLKDGLIGDLQMMQIRSLLPYTRYFHLWHRENKKSGGAFNDKCSHHYDVLNWFAQSNWKHLSATGGRSKVIAEDPNAPLRCSECDRPQCPYNLYEDPDLKQFNADFQKAGWMQATDPDEQVDVCVYRPGSDIIDHCISHITYQNGIKASLYFCIFGPSAKDQESFELIGSSGRIFMTRATGEIEVLSNHGKDRILIDARNQDFSSSHFGADLELLREIDRFAKGETPKVKSIDGHRSLEMIHASLQSIHSNSNPIFFGDPIHEQF